MSDLEEYIAERKKRDVEFAEDFEIGYERFKIGALIKEMRLEHQQDADRRRLAGPVGTQEAVHLPGGDLQVEAVEGGEAAETFDEGAHPDG